MSDVYQITEHGVEWEPIEVEDGKVVNCERIAVLGRALENTRYNYRYGKSAVVCGGYCALHECVCPVGDEDERPKEKRDD
mgnify:CR=1 FL=1